MAPIDRDRTIDPQRGSLLAFPLSFVLMATILLPFQLLWGVNALKPAFAATGWWGVLFVVLLAIGVHESLHALTWRYAGGGPRPSIEFGIQWRVLMPYAHPTSPMTLRRYRLGALAPGVLMGAVPGAWAVLVGDAVIAGWAAIFWAFAVGDLMVVAKLVDLPAQTLVFDHPTRVGCEVVTGNDQRRLQEQ